MTNSYHRAYVISSLVAALLAAMGVVIESPVLYGYVPGMIGGVCAAIASVRFLKHKEDLVGFIATVCGFVFYQAFQANPVTLPEFSQSLEALSSIDTTTGVFLGNFTTGMLLLAHRALIAAFGRPLRKLGGTQALPNRSEIDGKIVLGFLVVLVLVALPHVLFGKVVVGAYKNILYQRAAWSAPEDFSGFQVWGGAVGSSLVNTALWAPSLFFLWIYLLGSRYKVLVWSTAPFVLLWTASVAMQGSRTYLVIIGLGLVVYFLGNPRVGVTSIKYGLFGGVAMLLLLQISTLFRGSGLQGFDARELAERMFEIRGNEGTSSQIDGLEYFRTELLEKDAVTNPLKGLVSGMLLRPIEGILMPVPRTLFPWKPLDESQKDFSVFFQNVRLGAPSTEAFLGASPGLMGRELIRHGVFGPLTVLCWLGLVMAFADRLFAVGAHSDLHRIFAAVLAAFYVAQMRDWVPVWFLPFLPAVIVLVITLRTVRRSSKSGLVYRAETTGAVDDFYGGVSR